MNSCLMLFEVKENGTELALKKFSDAHTQDRGSGMFTISLKNEIVLEANKEYRLVVKEEDGRCLNLG